MNLIHFLCAQRFSGSLFCLFSFSIWALFNIVYCTLDYTVGSTEQCKNAKSNIGDASQSQRNTQNKRLRRMIWWWQYVQSVLFAHSCLLCIRNNVSVCECLTVLCATVMGYAVVDVHFFFVLDCLLFFVRFSSAFLFFAILSCFFSRVLFCSNIVYLNHLLIQFVKHYCSHSPISLLLLLPVCAFLLNFVCVLYCIFFLHCERITLMCCYGFVR